MTPGYFAMPERTADAIDPEGWLHSGDLATLDIGGYLRIVGRTKDMVIRGGENIYPAEIEDLLMHHPLVEQVQVVGVPDPEFGEEAFAFIIPRPGAELTEAALREYARASFSRHKVPRYMTFVDSFPQTASGKVQKFELAGSGPPDRRQRMTDAPHLLCETQGGVALLTLNRPAQRNAISPQMACLLADALAEAAADDSVRVVVLTGAGDRAFCSGGDLALTLPLMTGCAASRRMPGITACWTIPV